MPRRKSASPSSTPAKPVKTRYIAKPYGKKWRVYDKDLGSYPVQRPEFSSALPEFGSEEECQQVVDELERKRLNG